MDHVREHWSSRFGFMMAAIGSAIGLGILWKFPYTVGNNGGGIFFLIYVLCVVVIGFPLFIAELILGRGTQRAAVGAFLELDKKNAGWKIGAWLGVLASFLILSFYSVIAGWGMSYVLMSITGFYQGLGPDEIKAVYTELSTSGGISLLWHFIFMLICMGIVLSGVRKGIEYWSKFMTKALLVIMLFMFCYCLTLSGFGKAFEFIFYPNPANFKLSSMIEALGLALFTLSLGQGVMISYGSYMKPGEDVVKTAAIVAGSLLIVAGLAALTIFPVVFTFGLEPEAGSGLVFQTLPYLFSQLPGALVLSTLFFILFVFTAITSSIPLIEVVATNLMELYNLPRKKTVTLVSLSIFLFGVPSAFAYAGSIFPMWSEIYGENFLETINNLVSTWVIPLAGLITSIFVGWIMNKERCKEEFLQGSKLYWVWGPWRFFIKWIAPITIIIVILQKSGIVDLDRLFN